MRTKTVHSILKTSTLVLGCGLAGASALPQVGCSSGSPGGTPSSVGSGTPAANAQGNTGEVGVALTLPGGEIVNSVNYTITGPGGFALSNSVSVQNSTNIAFVVGGIPAGSGYSIAISGTSADGTVTCSGTSATFSIVARTTTTVTDTLQCAATVPEAGALSVNAQTYGCAGTFSGSISVSPSDTTVGSSVSLQAVATAPNASTLTYAWSAPSGTFSAPGSSATSFTCTTQGQVAVTVTVSDGPLPDGAPACAPASATALVTCNLLAPNSLVISTSTYSNTQGAVASLVVGTTLPNTADAGIAAIAGNDYVNVWFNAGIDGSFGITSPIQLLDINPSNGQVFSSFSVPTSQVVTSFSSKSELGLHYVTDSSGAPHIVFVGYASPGVGALDVSNSDAVPGQDPTNPVTFLFGPTYAFSRTIVSMDMLGNLTYTPTINYGGNNGRSALLGPNGLYYTVGNANNGNASTFGPNGTNPDVTETTGLEVVNPINASSADAGLAEGFLASNSAEVDPLVQDQFTDGGKLDKAGKDDNFRGVTQFGGALYFTKGSGSNGIDTVYTVPSLPTVANAASQTISVVPGFPTDSAKATGGNYTPFAVFFANPTTMYVTDEGSGNTTDTSAHAGLQKWSLVSGTWVLDYVLTNGLIGAVDSNVGADAGTTYLAPDGGADGPWPNVTTVGLRNMDGVVNLAAGTVTIWATTSTLSTSGDNGADPNKVVTITDQLSATTLSAVASEAFSVVVGPTYGTVYRGVAHVP